MFNELVECASGRKERQRRWLIAASGMLQGGGVAALTLIPLLYTQALPRGTFNEPGVLAVPVLPERPPERANSAPTGLRGSRIIHRGIMRAPTRIPERVYVFEEEALPPELPVNSGESPMAGSWNLLNELSEGRIEAPPPPPVQPERIRQMTIEPAMILTQPQPVYPALARMARIQGEVVLHAIIDREGQITELELVSGHPLLVEAALTAVRNWRYRPTMLRGQAVEVETVIRVKFLFDR
jgi:protein TonB